MMVRASFKRKRLFDTYAVLRCAMDSYDVAELLNKNPGFLDRTLDDTDKSIQGAIDDMTAAMIVVQPPNIEKATPLRRE